MENRKNTCNVAFQREMTIFIWQITCRALKAYLVHMYAATRTKNLMVKRIQARTEVPQILHSVILPSLDKMLGKTWILQIFAWEAIRIFRGWNLPC